jgi:ABC-2 type transport system ATP-binding protein
MIQVNDITFRYAGQKDYVFDGFSLTLEQNNIYGLLGKNGTGKSTLLYLISGLLRPLRGNVIVDGIDARKRNADMLSELFLVPEEFSLPPISLDEYVRLNSPFYPHFSREILEACLTDFELQPSLRLDALSMGQQKKAFMSFAMAAGTRLLLMDEPTNGLDIPSKSQFRKVVAEYMSKERTLIISTHQVHDVEMLLDHVLMLTPKQLLLDKSVEELTSRYVFEFRTSSDLQPSALDPQPSALNPQPSSLNPQPSALDPQPSSLSPQPSLDVIYAEPSLQGMAVIAERQEGAAETQLNLELLFNAVTKGLIK